MADYVVEFGKDGRPLESDGRLDAPAFHRNHQAIAEVLQRFLAGKAGDVVEAHPGGVPGTAGRRRDRLLGRCELAGGAAGRGLSGDRDGRGEDAQQNGRHDSSADDGRPAGGTSGTAVCIVRAKPDAKAAVPGNRTGQAQRAHHPHSLLVGGLVPEIRATAFFRVGSCRDAPPTDPGQSGEPASVGALGRIFTSTPVGQDACAHHIGPARRRPRAGGGL